jgi:hypothetical protein
MKNRIKGLVTAFFLVQMIWQLMNAGLAFSQMALPDVAFRLALTFIFAVTVVAIWGGEE